MIVVATSRSASVAPPLVGDRPVFVQNDSDAILSQVKWAGISYFGDTQPVVFALHLSDCGAFELHVYSIDTPLDCLICNRYSACTVLFGNNMQLEVNLMRHRFRTKLIIGLMFTAGITLHTTPAIANQFDGDWRFRVVTTHGPCFAAPGLVLVTNGKISGSVKGVNETFRVTGSLKDDGTLKGRISKGMANFKGSVSGGSGSATWSGRGGCKGTIQMNKS